MSGLLMVLSDAPKGREHEFNTWYDEHARARLTVPGVASAVRYQSINAEPEYMADYELESVDVLQTPSYTRLRTNRPAGEQEMLDSLPAPVDRRVYRSIGESINDGFSIGASTHALGVWMSVKEPEDFHRWYEEEHIPLLFKVPGWLRIRRYELVEGGGPRFLALHDLAAVDTVDDPRAAPARQTEWRAKVAAYRTAYERRLYRLMERF